MFGNEVNYRLAKWLLLNMAKDDILSFEELQLAWKKIGEHYNPPFLELEDVNGIMGDEVTVDGR